VPAGLLGDVVVDVDGAEVVLDAAPVLLPVVALGPEVVDVAVLSTGVAD
jgi:hypothetical protein